MITKYFTQLLDTTNKKVTLYGAQYKTFALFGLINYPLAYFFEFLLNKEFSIVELALRIIPTLLCLGLFFKNKWPENLKKYISLYWYMTITFSLPFVIGYMILKYNFSLNWLINANVGFFLLILLSDWLTFLIIAFVGVTLGASLFYLTEPNYIFAPNSEYLATSIYMFICIFILGSIFSRNKEIYNNFLLKAKDDFNNQLDSIVRERTKELEEALLAKKYFLNNVSHEVRTPLVGIVSLSKALYDNWKNFNDEEKFRNLSIIKDSSLRLEDLMSNILDLAKFETGKMEINKIRFNIEVLTRQTIQQTLGLAFAQGKDVNIDIEKKWSNENDAFIHADPNKIKQVIYNLISNAIKYGEQKNRIKITLEHSRNFILFSISDQGIGIPIGEENMIFNLFSESSKTKSNAGGKGLGLSLCRQIINSHNGKIWAEHNLETHGSIFKFTLPINVIKQKSKPSIKTNKTLVNKNLISIEHKSILVVDDEQTCLMSLNIILNSFKTYEIILIEGGIKALEYLNKHHDEVKLVLIDLIMPDLHGINVIEYMRKDNILKNIPIIVQSGCFIPEEQKYLKSLGIEYFLNKPYKKDVVIETVNKIIKI